MNNYTIDIVIPQYKNVDLLRRNLESLELAVIPSTLISIWVIENGGKCGAEELVREFSGVLPLRYSYISEGSLSKARNYGVQVSEADVIIFFDNDISVTKTTLVSYSDAIQTYGRNCFFGGPLEAEYESSPKPYVIPYLPYSAKGFYLGEFDLKIDDPCFLGGNHALFREDVIAAGGYDEKCATGNNSGALGEETRLQARLIAMSRQGVYVSGAKVRHWVPDANCSSRWLLKRAMRTGWTAASEESVGGEGGRTFLSVPYYNYRFLFSNFFALLRALLTFRLGNIFGSLYGLLYRVGAISFYIKGSRDFGRNI